MYRPESENNVNTNVWEINQLKSVLAACLKFKANSFLIVFQRCEKLMAVLFLDRLMSYLTNIDTTLLLSSKYVQSTSHSSYDRHDSLKILVVAVPSLPASPS